MAKEKKIVSVEDFEKYAKLRLDKNAFDYYSSGAQDMLTVSENQKAYNQIYILPRILRDVTEIDTSINFLGKTLSSPILIAPSAMQKMAHIDGECATAAATTKRQAGMVLSSWSTTSLEDVISAAKTAENLEKGVSGIQLFQLYIYKDRDVTEKLVRRAQSAGYKGLVITVDAPYLGRRLADIRNKFQLPEPLTMGNFSAENISNTRVGYQKADNAAENDSGLATYVASQIDPSITWEHIKWIMALSKMPVFVKGVLTKEDAEIAISIGVSGIIVSNHGGRQLDSVPATIEALPNIVKAVAGRIGVFVDGGIRRGTDVFKALALGAKAVFIGRPVLYALAYDGENGVTQLYDIMLEEFRLAMALAGCPKIRDINSSYVMSKYAYSDSSKL